MTADGELGQVLVGRGLMTEAQLATALDFQRSLGGDLRNIVVRLGFVSDSALVGLVTDDPAGPTEIADELIDIGALKTISQEVLEKHQVVPLRSPDTHVLLVAMADPNDLLAIEELQFLVNKSVEPAVASPAAIRQALARVPLLRKRRADGSRGKLEARAKAEAPRSKAEARAKAEAPRSKPTKARASGGALDVVQALRETPTDKLIRAYLLLQIERGELSAVDLLTRARSL